MKYFSFLSVVLFSLKILHSVFLMSFPSIKCIRLSDVLFIWGGGDTWPCSEGYSRTKCTVLGITLGRAQGAIWCSGDLMGIN